MDSRLFVARLGTNAGALLVGSVFAGAGWLVTYVVESVVSVPTIEYEFTIVESNKQEVSVTLHNLSENHKFSNLEFMLRLPVNGSGKFQDASIHPIPPAYVEREPVNTQEIDVTYPSIGLHPGTSVKLNASFSGDKVPTFHVAPAGEAARLIENGYVSWIIRNNIEVLIFLLLVWSVAVTVALCSMSGGDVRGDT